MWLYRKKVCFEGRASWGSWDQEPGGAFKIVLADGWNHIHVGDISDYLLLRRAVLRTRTVREVIELAICATTIETVVKLLPREKASRNRKRRLLDAAVEKLRPYVDSARSPSGIAMASRAATPKTHVSKVKESKLTQSRSPGVQNRRVQVRRVETPSASESYSEESCCSVESSGSESYPEEEEEDDDAEDDDAEDDDALDKKMTQMAWVCKHCAQVTGAQTMFAQLVFRVPPGIALQRARLVSNTESFLSGAPHEHL